MDKNRLPVMLKSRLPTTETQSIKTTQSKSQTQRKDKRRAVKLAAVLLGIFLIIGSLILLLSPKLTDDGDKSYPLFLFLIHQSFPPSSGTTSPIVTDTQSESLSDTSPKEPSSTSAETTALPETAEQTESITDESTESDTTGAAEASDTDSDVPESENLAPDTSDKPESEASPDVPRLPQYSDESLSHLGAHYIHNTTVFIPEVSNLSEMPFPDISAVLIITSRKNDAYADGKGNVGDIAGLIKERLSDKGIGVLYADTPDGADTQAIIDYYTSLYPEITLVLDLRRSAEPSATGELLRPLCFIGDGGNIPCAQIRFICDSRGGGAGMTEKNLAIALKLRSDLFKLNSTISRPVWLREGNSISRSGIFFLTVEVGAAGNTFAEAVTAADILAEILYERMCR